MSTVLGLEWLRAGTTDHLIGTVTGGTLVDYLAAASVVSGGSARLPESVETNASWVEGALYLGNGTDPNVRYDGTNVKEVMPAGPTAAPTKVSSVGSGHPAGDYSYIYCFVTADGHYTEASPPVSFTVFGNVDISVQTIAAPPAGHDITGRAVFRMSGGSTEYRFAHLINDTTTTVWVDNVADVDLGDAFNFFNAPMPPVQYSCEHNSRWIGAGSASDLQSVYVSNKFEPWYCPESPDTEDPNQGTRAKVQGRAAGAVTGVCSHGAYVACFTAGSGYFLSGDEPLDFALTKFCDHGCTSHRTIKSVRNWLIWLAPDGVYAWVDGVSQRISDDVRTAVEAMTASDMALAHAYVWDDKYFLCWPSGTLYFDLLYKQWGENTGKTWDVAAVSVYTGAGREAVYAAEHGSARVFHLETGATDDGTDILMRWASKDWDCGYGGREKRAHYIETRWKKGIGTATIRLKKGSGQECQAITHDLSAVDDATETVSRQLTSCVEQARSEFFRLDVTIASPAAVVELEQAALHFTLST